MTPCPFCAEPIHDAAIVCRYCGRTMPQPPPLRDPRERLRRNLGLLTTAAILAIVVGSAALWLWLRLPEPTGAWTACLDAARVRLPSAATPTFRANDVIAITRFRYRVVTDLDASTVLLCEAAWTGEQWQILDLRTTRR